MTGVTEPRPPDDPTPADTPIAAEPASPGERRLAHPPSDRYRAAEAAAAEAPQAAPPDPAASVPRGIAIATVVAIVGAVAIVVLGGILALSAGLVVVAAVIGWGVAIALRVGAGDHLAPRRRLALALTLSLGSVALGQLGLWQYARTEGGVLAPLDYLAEVFGFLVPFQFGAAAAAAWLSAR